jgi:hypothetical protein
MRNKTFPFIIGLIILIALIAWVLPLLSGGGDPVDPEDPGNPEEYVQYTFRNEKLLKEHFEKHGIEMGFSSEEEYQQAASDVANDPEALHKLEKEDGDDVYYLEETNEFVVVSTDGFIRTYFCPDSGIKYFEKQ